MSSNATRTDLEVFSNGEFQAQVSEGVLMAGVETLVCETCNRSTCDPSNHPGQVPLVDGVRVTYGEPHAEVARLRALLDRACDALDDHLSGDDGEGRSEFAAQLRKDARR